MPWTKVKHDDGKVCVHKENADGSAGEELTCYTGKDADDKANKYLSALYANLPADEKKKAEKIDTTVPLDWMK